ncbi:MAG: lipocalin-like domain-containing protein [Phycisphaerae bacterium]
MPSCLFFLLFLVPVAFADQGFKQVIQPRAWQFPQDFGRHDEFETEWWYFTGNLFTDAGRHFGYQVTFFRSGMSPGTPDRPSRWAASDLYYAHAAITDIERRRFAHHDLLSRARPGLAWAADDTLDVRLLDWHAKLVDARTIKLFARDDDGRFEIDLTATIERGPILQGPGGVSKKGREPGQASYYHSITRLRTAGTLTIDGEAHAVTGLSWMDQEFSSNVLSDGQVGWDWLCLQMADGRDIKAFQLRREDGTADYTAATVVAADCTVAYLDPADVVLDGSEPWTSPTTGGAYPQHWRVKLGRETLTVRSLLPDQEISAGDAGGVSYFEGAIEAVDEAGNVVGRGYLEMTGYDEPLSGF